MAEAWIRKVDEHFNAPTQQPAEKDSEAQTLEKEGLKLLHSYDLPTEKDPSLMRQISFWGDSDVNLSYAFGRHPRLDVLIYRIENVTDQSNNIDLEIEMSPTGLKDEDKNPTEISVRSSRLSHNDPEVDIRIISPFQQYWESIPRLNLIQTINRLTSAYAAEWKKLPQQAS